MPATAVGGDVCVKGCSRGIRELTVVDGVITHQQFHGGTGGRRQYQTVVRSPGNTGDRILVEHDPSGTVNQIDSSRRAVVKDRVTNDIGVSERQSVRDARSEYC